MTEKRWVMLPNGRSVFRRIEQAPPVARSSFPCPRIMSDRIEPVQSMADGKTYDSLSALRRTYRADGNPFGETFTEVGDAEISYQAPEFDRQSRRDHIRQAIADVRDGNVPTPVTD